MTTPAASEVVSAANPTFSTVGEVAHEIARLYAAYDTSAVKLTTEYIQQQLAGEEGVTWVMFPRGGFLSRPTPYLNSILCQDGKILLGAGYNMWFNLLYEYQLTKVAILLPGDDETFTMADAIIVRRSGRGFDPGSEYVVNGSRVLKAGYDHHGSVPTVGAEGKLAWSTPRSWVNSTYREVTEVSADLREVVERLRVYEPAAG